MLTVLLLILMLSLQAWHPLACLEEERIALLHLKHSLNYPNATSLPYWREADVHCCDWERIGCNSSTGRVTRLYLWSIRNQELGDWYLNASLFLPLQQLKALYLDGNSIAGWVEKKGGYELHKLSNLEILDLGYNSFNNSILSSVEGLPSLKSLSLSHNRLEGLIDLKESLSSLEHLSLDGNNINKLVASRGPSNLRTLLLGNITTYGSSFQLLQSLGAFPNLTTLSLSYNDFRGRTLGDELQNSSSLESLYLNGCSLDEHVLQSLGALPSLKNLSMRELNSTVLSRGFLDLKNLEYLDLRYNTLNNNIFQTIGTMTSLKALKLHGCNFSGQLPTTQGFLDFKNLEYLDLSYTTLNNSIFQTIGTMTSLKTLQLWGCNLNGQIPTTQGLCNLNHLEELDMSNNDLSGFLPPCLANLTSLQQLYLGSNHLKIPMSLSPLYNLLRLKSFDGSGNEIFIEEDDHNMSPKFQLEYLYLSYNTLNNSIFQTIEMLTSLKTLKLEDCSLNDQIPTTQGLCNLNHLEELDMRDNDLSGFLPPCLANLTSLQQLHLDSNHLKIPMSLSPLYNLSRLKSFYGSGNEIFTEKDDHNLSPKFQLEYLYLSGIGQGGAFPKFLYHQFSLQYLDLTNIQIKGEFPHWLIENNTFLQELYLENCSLSGPFLLPKNSHVNLSFLSIYMNHFQGQIPSEIGDRLPGLEVLRMSDNGFNGIIPSSLGNMSSLYELDLSNNNLTGRVPEWIGRLSNLRYLLLSYNNLEGEIPFQLCKLDQLTLIDLSHNYLSGNILSCIISTAFFTSSTDAYSPESSQESFEFTAKNVSLSYRGSILHYFTGIDFSYNNFTGKIPPEIGNLRKIKALNLSHNNLVGPIPPTFSRLKEIESLDLSYNKLVGEIPPQLTELYFLVVFSVAHNNLSGKTPASVAQFSLFEESCYKDNPFLCGEPLAKVCRESLTLTTNKDNSGFMDMEVFYVTFGVAYIMVLLVIGAVLYINPYWRRAWFYFIEVSINNCYYFLVDNLPILSKFGFS